MQNRRPLEFEPEGPRCVPQRGRIEHKANRLTLPGEGMFPSRQRELFAADGENESAPSGFGPKAFSRGQNEREGAQPVATLKASLRWNASHSP